MRRKSSNQHPLIDAYTREIAAKNRSPQTKKNKSKSKLVFSTFVVPTKTKQKKTKDSRQQFVKYDSRADMNQSTTHCTLNKTKIVKISKKEKPKTITMGMSESEIFQLINGFATKIQRQWRIYYSRKMSKQKITQKNQLNRKQILKAKIQEQMDSSAQGNESKFIQKPHLNLRNLNPIQKSVSQSMIQQNQSNYNNLKYQKQLDESIGSRNIADDSSLSSFRNEPQTIIDSQIKKERQSNESVKYNSQSSGSQNQKINRFQIDKVVQINIAQHSSSPPKQKKKSPRIQSKSLQNSRIKKLQREENAFKEKYPFQKMLKKCKHALQTKKLKKLLSIENRYSNNQLTYRSYQAVLDEIHLEHKNQLEMLNAKEVHMKDNWNEIYSLYKKNINVEWKFLEDQDHEHDQSKDAPSADKSSSFDRWDFTISAKKTENNLDSLSQYVNQSQNKQSIQVVLNQLDLEEDYKKENIDESHSQIKNFQKKHKKLQFVESVNELNQLQNERSSHQCPQTNSNDNQFNEISLNNQKQILNKILQKQNNHLHEFDDNLSSDSQLISNPFHNCKLNKAQIPKQERFLDISLEVKQEPHNRQQNGSKKKQIEQIKSEKSLLISQHILLQEEQEVQRSEIELKLPTQQIEEIEEQNAVDILKKQKFIDKLFQNNLAFDGVNVDESVPIFSIDEIQGEIQKSQKNLQKSDALRAKTLISKFHHIVEQKFLLYQIKVYSLLKNVLSRVAKSVIEERRKKKYESQINKYCPINTDIDAVNSWLLQISHFILDAYQMLIRDNLINIKQPHPKELIKFIKRPEQFFPMLYQTIPQLVFKQFEHFHIQKQWDVMEAPIEKKDHFSTSLYIFHRLLVDSLNIALMDELLEGKVWLRLPWKSQFHKKKKVQHEHAKQCLQRAINIVSNWAEYSMARLEFVSEQIHELQLKHYEQQKLQMMIKEEVFEEVFNFEFYESWLMNEVSNMIFQEQVSRFSAHFSQIQAKRQQF